MVAPTYASILPTFTGRQAPPPAIMVRDTALVSVTPTITASAYSSGNVVGGLLTIANAFRVPGGQVTLQDMVVIDKGNQKAPFTILFFDSLPAQTYTDKTACPTIDGDGIHITAQVLVATADYTTTGGSAVAHEKTISAVLVNNEGTTNLYVVVVTTGTPTPTSTSDLTFRFKMFQD